ncbi:hypothetical protein GAH_02028 [Geoglobus ahangari]|uniref:DUF460 domain-containing protein n=1 Tax=Geoglobus ahangari TaxID=113653 RepID=A0A0F7IBX2_9EURY|nr:DUF460 domain-containing protein [Geoglobus ahangari]AKG90702.1 hypothetical protein GAH_02028 [Geoglobus ahangari]
MRIFGVDILRGSSRSKSIPRYALYVIDGEEEWSREVSRSRFFRYIRDYRPDFVATDNIFELFRDKRELISFLKSIPPETRFVQTAGHTSLPKLARRYGIHVDPKNPFDEARASALLVKYGVGEVVSVFADRTIIKVSRNRSLGKGGWRQNKYRRKVHNSVRAVYREIKSILDEHGLEYVEDVREGYGGISRGVLLVNEPRERVPINSFRMRDVQVTVEAVEKEKIELIPMKRQTTYTIVGIDPGATVGVAILDLNGNVLAVRSKKGWSYSEVVEFILSHGKPVVIATDKKSAPEYISKMRASFNCILHCPKEDIPVERKKALTAGKSIANDHERDALASALDAYNTYRNKLRNVEKRIPEGYDFDEIKAGIIRGLSLKSMLERKTSESREGEEREKEAVAVEEVRKRDRIIAELREENRRLEEEVRRLKKEIERLKERIYTISSEEHRKIREKNVVKSLQSEIRDLRRAISEKDKKIEELESKLDELRKVKYLEFRGWKAIKVLRKFTKDEIERVLNTVGIEEGDVVYISEVAGGGKSSAETLVSRGVRAIVASGEMSHYAKEVFESSRIPVIPAEEVKAKLYDEFALVESDVLEECIERYRKEMEKRSLEKIEELIFEYRSRRMGEF